MLQEQATESFATCSSKLGYYLAGDQTEQVDSKGKLYSGGRVRTAASNGAIVRILDGRRTSMLYWSNDN